MVIEWTEVEIASLRRHYAEPEVSIAQIAAALGRSKSSVARKVRDLRLPLRGNPIDSHQQWTEEKLAKLKGFAATTLSYEEMGAKLGFSRAAIGYKLKALGLARGSGRRSRSNAPNKAIPVARARPIGPLKAKVFKEAGRSEPCCWPIGMPRTPNFRYCDAPSMLGRPYCEPHFAMAHRDVCQREEAA